MKIRIETINEIKVNNEEGMSILNAMNERTKEDVIRKLNTISQSFLKHETVVATIDYNDPMHISFSVENVTEDRMPIVRAAINSIPF